MRGTGRDDLAPDRMSDAALIASAKREAAAYQKQLRRERAEDENRRKRA